MSRHRAEVDAVEELEDDRAVPSKLGVGHVALYDVQLDLAIRARALDELAHRLVHEDALHQRILIRARRLLGRARTDERRELLAWLGLGLA